MYDHTNQASKDSNVSSLTRIPAQLLSGNSSPLSFSAPIHCNRRGSSILSILIIVSILILAAMLSYLLFFKNDNQAGEDALNNPSENSVDAANTDTASDDTSDEINLPASLNIDRDKIGDLQLLKNAIGFIEKSRRQRDSEHIGLTNSNKEEVEKAYLSRITVIRDAYVFRLQAAASQTMDSKLKSKLLAQAESAKDLKAWLGMISPEPQQPRKKVAATHPKPTEKKVESKRVDIQEGASDIVGKWDQYSATGRAKNYRWMAHANGRMEIVGQNWEITWEMTEDGNLSVDWNKRKPSIYKRDGKNWVGKTSFGHTTILKPGTW